MALRVIVGTVRTGGYAAIQGGEHLPGSPLGRGLRVLPGVCRPRFYRDSVSTAADPVDAWKDVELGELVEPFLRYRATATRRGLSAKSQEAYRADLLGWARDISRTQGRLPDLPGPEDRDPLTLVTLSDLNDVTLQMAFQVIRNNSEASTAQRRVGTMNLFIAWLRDKKGVIAHDPMADIVAPNRKKTLPAGWEDDELLKLAEVASTPALGPDRRGYRWPVRDRAMFAVLATTGVRAAELCSTTDRSLVRESGGEAVLVVIGKGNQQRNVPVPPETIEAVDAYLEERGQRFGKRQPSEPMFMLANGKPMNRTALNYLVGTWIQRAQVPKQPGEAVHGFRHTFAKGLIRAGVPVPSVQELLGHADLKTTGIYLRATAADVREASLLSPARAVLRATSAPAAALPAPG